MTIYDFVLTLLYVALFLLAKKGFVHHRDLIRRLDDRLVEVIEASNVHDGVLVELARKAGFVITVRKIDRESEQVRVTHDFTPSSSSVH